MKERPIKKSVKPETIKNQLIKEVEEVVHKSGDSNLDIPSFFERIVRSVQRNGNKTTAEVYCLPIETVERIENYIHKIEGENQ